MRVKLPNTSAVTSLLILSTFALIGCQTTRRPSAIRSADNASLLVQVSEDPNSLMWSDTRSKHLESISTNDKKESSVSDRTHLQMRAELSLIGHMTRAAADNARALLKQDLRNVKALKSLVKAALMERKPHEALSLSASAMSLTPQDAELYSYEGLAQFQLDNVLYAKALWEKALSLDPLHIPSLMNLAVLLFQNGHSKKAGSYFDRVLALQPQHLDAQVGRALVQSAEGEHQLAISELENIMKRTGDNALVLENLAHISRERMRDYKKASQYVERTLALKNVDRRIIEAAVGHKQELRRLMANQEKQLTDENLRDMAKSSSVSDASLQSDSSASSNVATPSDLKNMEDSLK